jgi:hypothetical protein
VNEENLKIQPLYLVKGLSELHGKIIRIAICNSRQVDDIKMDPTLEYLVSTFFASH